MTRQATPEAQRINTPVLRLISTAKMVGTSPMVQGIHRDVGQSVFPKGIALPGPAARALPPKKNTTAPGKKGGAFAGLGGGRGERGTGVIRTEELQLYGLRSAAEDSGDPVGVIRTNGLQLIGADSGARQ
jgi:hypothetical protein